MATKKKKTEVSELISNTVTSIRKQEQLATLKDTGDIFQWRGDVWVNSGEIRIKELTETLLNDDASRFVVSEVVEKIKRQTYIDRAMFDSDDNMLNVANHVLNLDTGEVTDHLPELYQTIQIPVNHSPEATCPAIEKFVNEVMGTYSELFYEILAYCLIPDYRFKKFFIFLGEANTGKTTAIELMCRFLGIDNISGITLQNLADNRFVKANLYGKIANICDDLPRVEYNDVGQIKQLTGNSPINAEIKHVQRLIAFTNRAKLVFTCNAIPKTRGSDAAFYSRLIIVPFTFKPDKVDNMLIDKLTTDTELSGLLNKVLEARKRICDNGGFSIEQSIEDVQHIYNIGSLDSVAGYAHDRLEYDMIGTVLKEVMYSDYLEYCGKNSLTVKECNAFHRRIQELGYGDTVHITVSGQRKWAYSGIKMKVGK